MLWLSHWLGYFLLTVVCADYLRIGRALRRMKAVQAEIVANALGNAVLVDGVELPKPEDERWVQADKITVNGNPMMNGLRLGPVIIDNDTVLVGVNNSPPMRTTKETEKYCTAVWKAYRSRVARKAIENNT